VTGGGGSLPAIMGSELSPEPETHLQAPMPGLRDRRRTRTRRMIQDEALRLFAEKGYEQTTVEDIADAAAISPRTFFRYFPTRADVVLWDESDPWAFELLAPRRADEPVAEALRSTIRSALAALYQRDAQRLLTRVKLTAAHPELRAREATYRAAGGDALAAQLASKRGRPADDLEVRVTVEAVIATSVVAIDRWEHDDGQSDLVALFDQAIDALTAGIQELTPTTHPSRRGAPRR
jgi:AcrR family transcriptional regulator